MEPENRPQPLPLEALHQVSLQISAELELERLLRLVVEQATNLLQGCAGGYHRYNPERDVLEWTVAFGRYASPVGSTLRRGEGVAGHVLRTGLPVTLDSEESLPVDGGKLVPNIGPRRSVAAVPVVWGKEFLGVLHVLVEPPRGFSSDDVRLLSLFANQAAVAVRNARLVEALQDSQIMLRQYADELRIQNEELDAFSHTVAHDLKSPLANLLMFVQLLEEGYENISAEELELGTEALGRNVRKAINIVEELLLLASVRKEDVTRSPLNMEAIVRESCRRLSDVVERYSGKIEYAGAWPTVVGYAPWVEEVWINYISNALKYGGTPPVVQLGADIAPNRTVKFWVRDNGPGIPAEQQARLFTPFTKLEQAKTTGTGLGLSIVRRIVEKLGGEVGLESPGEPGQGCTFYFTLPGYRSSI